MAKDILSNLVKYPDVYQDGEDLQILTGARKALAKVAIFKGDGTLQNFTLGRTAYPVTITAETAAAVLTIAELLTGIVIGTQSTGSTNALTLPTGTLSEAAFDELPIGSGFEWSIINLSAAAADTYTLTATTAHTIVGNPIVQSAHVSTGGIMGNSARFFTKKSALNTFITYRIA